MGYERINESGVENVDALQVLSAEDIALLAGQIEREGQIYRKVGLYDVRPVQKHEVVDTKLGDFLETTNIGKGDGDMIVTNPNGEEYIVSAEEFAFKYQATETPGKYQAIGYVRAIQNPYDRCVDVQQDWGMQRMKTPDAMFAMSCDSAGVVRGTPYIVGNDEFFSTYASVSNG